MIVGSSGMVASILNLPPPNAFLEVEFKGTGGSPACCMAYGIRWIRGLPSITLDTDVLDLLALIVTRSALADAISIFLCEISAILPRFLPGIKVLTFRRVP